MGHELCLHNNTYNICVNLLICSSFCKRTHVLGFQIRVFSHHSCLLAHPSLLRISFRFHLMPNNFLRSCFLERTHVLWYQKSLAKERTNHINMASRDLCDNGRWVYNGYDDIIIEMPNICECFV